MRFTVLLGILAAGSAGQTAPPTQRSVIDVSVDPRVELMCIIFQLAGNDEYCRPSVPAYARDVERHFGPFRNHAVVELVKRLRQNRGVGFDAPMSLAVHFADAKTLTAVVPLDPLPDEIDGRWRASDVREFTVLARQFAEQAAFDAFFEAHRDLYAQSAGRMRQTLERHAQLDWFDDFFGSRPGARFHLVLGMLNGPSNYGVRAVVAGREELYCIPGVWQCDDEGLAQFPRSVVPTVVHEFSHSYVNPLVEKHLDQIRAAGEKLFKQNEALMQQQAYANGRTVLMESLVRACVVRYRYANEGTAAGVAEVVQQKARGFAWTGELSALLDEYEKNRSTYPTMELFMPRIVEFFNDYAAGLPER